MVIVGADPAEHVVAGDVVLAVFLDVMPLQMLGCVTPTDLAPLVALFDLRARRRRSADPAAGLGRAPRQQDLGGREQLLAISRDLRQTRRVAPS
jgi:hypothetical protein